MSSIIVRLAYGALARGMRTPELAGVRVFHQQGRTLDAMKARDINIVIDAGANRGYYSQHLRMGGYTGEIYAFEPVPQSFADLEKGAKGDRKWHVFNQALGQEAGEIEFNVIESENELVMSSALEPIFDFPSTEITVPVTTVDSVISDIANGQTSRVFLKMDTQGFDMQIFNGAKNNEQIVLLQSEVSMKASYAGMPHFTESLAVYEQAGFELLDLFLVARNHQGAIGEMDVLMGRDSSGQGPVKAIASATST